MSFLVRKLIGQLARKVASDPVAREKALKVAQGMVKETEKISKQDDRAYAAGRALRRALNGSQNKH